MNKNAIFYRSIITWKKLSPKSQINFQYAKNTLSLANHKPKHEHIHNPYGKKPTRNFKTLPPPCLQGLGPFFQHNQMETNLLSLCIHPQPIHCLTPVKITIIFVRNNLLPKKINYEQFEN